MLGPADPLERAAGVSALRFRAEATDFDDWTLRRTLLRMSMMVRRNSVVTDIYAVGAEATRVLSGITGISDIMLESQYVDRATLSYTWKPARPSFDSRPDFSEIDRDLLIMGLLIMGMHRMQ